MVVLFGVVRLHPGLTVIAAIAAVIPVVRTIVVVAAREDKGAPVSRLAAIGLFVTSLAVTWVVLGVLGLSAVGAFFATCLVVVGSPTGRFGLLLTVLLASLAVVATLTPFVFRWIARRYRRDKGEL